MARRRRHPLLLLHFLNTSLRRSHSAFDLRIGSSRRATLDVVEMQPFPQKGGQPPLRVTMLFKESFAKLARLVSQILLFREYKSVAAAQPS